MLDSSEASPFLLYVHVHVYVYHVHIHFFYSVSDCASGCSTLLVFLFLARRGYSLSYLGLALLQRRALIPHPHISTSSHLHILTSPHSHIPTFPASPHPHIPTSPLTPMVIRHPSTKSRGHANWYVPVQISR